MESGEARSRADLARQEGVSAMRVTQVLALLDLHPEIQNAIRALPSGSPERCVSERRLRPLTQLPGREQIREIERLVPGLITRKGRGVA